MPFRLQVSLRSIVRFRFVAPFFAAVFLSNCQPGAPDSADDAGEKGSKPDLTGPEPSQALSQSLPGKIQSRQEKPVESIESLQESVKLEPGQAQAHFALGSALAAEGREEEAIESLLTAVELDPDLAEAHLGLGDSLANLGNVGDAIEPYRRAIELDPDLAGAHRKLGVALDLLGQLEPAIIAYRRAIELEPDQAQWHLDLGIALANFEKPAQSEEALRRAIELDPSLAEAHLYLGILLGAQGDLAGAIQSFRQAIEADPNLAEAHFNLGIGLGKQGREDEALEAYRKTVALDPTHAKAMGNVALLYATRDQVDRCGVWLARASMADGMMDEDALVKVILAMLKKFDVEIPVTASPSDDAIQNFYQEHEYRWSDSSIHLRMISGSKLDKTREFMETLQKALIGGQDFAEAAEVHSTDSFASEGGDRGWVKRGDLREDLELAAFALGEGKFSEVIEDDTHFRILNVVERKGGKTPPLDEIRSEVISAMRDAERSAQVRKWIEQARKEMMEGGEG